MSVRPRPLCLLVLAVVAALPAAAAETKRLDVADAGYVQIDPVRMTTTGDERVVLALFEGLTVLDPVTGKAAPGAAASWTADPSGTSWTFAIRPDAVWDDGKPVLAKDFVFAWRRMLDPFNSAPQMVLFRALRGVPTLQRSLRGLAATDALSKGLKEKMDASPTGIPGDELSTLLDDSGARPYVERLENKDVRRMLKWGSDPFPAEKGAEARKAVAAERKKFRDAVDVSVAAFGKTGGVLAKDDRTLVVETEGWHPELPEIVARAAFVPLREDVLAARRDGAFEAAGFVGNGPYRLKGRGSKPRRGLDKPESIVHLVKSAKYVGPNAGVVDEVFCWTDLADADLRRRFAEKSLQWMAAPPAEAKKELEKNPAFRTRPSGGVLCLVVRCDKKPFDRKDARRAFALSVERAALAKMAWPEGDAAERIVPPGVPGAAVGIAAPRPDAAQAKDALKDALKALGIKLEEWPWIETFHADLDGPSAVASALMDRWNEVLGIDSSARPDTGTQANALAGGKFAFALRDVRGAWNDAAAYLEPFHPSHPESVTGWEDEAFDLMIRGLHDVEAIAAGVDKVVAVAKDGPTLKARVEAAKAGGEAAKQALRQHLLAEAEHRLLAEFVVVPIAFPRRAELLQDVKGLGGDEAWKNPAFVGSLRAATR